MCNVYAHYLLVYELARQHTMQKKPGKKGNLLSTDQLLPASGLDVINYFFYLAVQDVWEP